MSLTNAYLVGVGRVGEFFRRLQDGQAPEQFTNQLLRDWGFSSSNDRAYIPLLKALGFLSPDGKPTSRYHAYRDHSRSKSVMAEALRDAYRDLFLIKENPGPSDRSSINGKFKSYHNASDNTSGSMTRTFLALSDLADFTGTKPIEPHQPTDSSHVEEPGRQNNFTRPPRDGLTLSYNIQIHLPATKDVEVFNAIFRSLKEHILND